MTILGETVEALWARPRREQPIRSGEDYIESLRGRNLAVHYIGERVGEPVDHPMIRPEHQRRRRARTTSPSNSPTSPPRIRRSATVR